MVKFLVRDRKTNQLMGTYKRKSTARNKVDKLDNQYGAYRYGIDIIR